ncbi:MAG: hypothetical protein ACK5O2_00565 [Microthrixaceae bacterium]
MPRPHQVQVYRDSEGRWRWRRRAGNYQVVAASEQGHRHRWYMIRKARRQNRGVEVVVIDGDL